MKALDDVLSEREAQDRKWGKQRHPDPVWLTILTEELGEVAERILHGDREGVRAELVQVAAVSLAWLEHLDSGDEDEERAPEPELCDCDPGEPWHWCSLCSCTRYKKPEPEWGDTMRLCPSCGKETRASTAGCDHCSFEDK